MEEEAIQHHQHLRPSLTQAENSYWAIVQQEARIYSDELNQELLYHQTAQAQAESLLAAERQRSEHKWQEQADTWRDAMNKVTAWGEEAVEQERSLTVEAEVETNIFRLELQEAQEQLQAWDDWCSGILPEAESSSLHQEESTSSLPAIPDQVQGTSSHLTPPVFQSQTLLPRHLPPQTLPFQNFASRVAETAQEEEAAEEQRAALQVLQKNEEQSPRSLSATDELEKARQVPRLLATRTGGFRSSIFYSHLDSSTWGMHLPINHRFTPLLQQQDLSSASSGLPSLSGVCSPQTPHAYLYPNPQVTLPTLPQEEGNIDLKGEKSALPKLQIKGGGATSITRTIHEWLQRTSIALNTWRASAVQLWHNAVALAKGAHQQWTMMAPSQRALQTGLPSTGHVLPAQRSVLEAIMRSDLCNHCLPDKSNLWRY